MRRKSGGLVPLETNICLAAAALRRLGIDQFHGYLIAKEIAAEASRQLIAYGTLYRALGRLEQMGLLASVWEDAQVAAADNRPRRRLYGLTSAGLEVATTAMRTTAMTAADAWESL